MLLVAGSFFRLLDIDLINLPLSSAVLSSTASPLRTVKQAMHCHRSEADGNERGADYRDASSKPGRQENIPDRPVLGAEVLSYVSKKAATASHEFSFTLAASLHYNGWPGEYAIRQPAGE
jgi:hypothetical protein